MVVTCLYVSIIYIRERTCRWLFSSKYFCHFFSYRLSKSVTWIILCMCYCATRVITCTEWANK